MHVEVTGSVTAGVWPIPSDTPSFSGLNPRPRLVPVGGVCLPGMGSWGGSYQSSRKGFHLAGTKKSRHLKLTVRG